MTTPTIAAAAPRRPSSKHRLELAVHLGALIPVAVFFVDQWLGRASPDLIRDLTLRTGFAALIFLLLSLSVTPVVSLSGLGALNPLRRWLGIYAFVYALIHLSIFVALDYGLDPALLADALLQKPYALAGLGAFMILLPLAATSTDAFQRRLKRNWKRLHRAVYLAAALVIVHFVWLVKPGVLDPWWYAGVLAVLLLLRVRPIRRWIAAWHRRSA